MRNFGKFLEKHQKLLSNITTDISPQYTSNPTAKISSEQFGPIRIKYAGEDENISYFQLIDSDNKILNKILIAFTHLCKSAYTLTDKSQELIQKFLYHDEDLSEVAGEEPTGYGNIIKLSEILKFLFEIKNFLNQCVAISTNITKQLGALFDIEKSYLNLQTSLHFQSVFNRLSDLVHIIAIFDEILPNSNIMHNWITYKKSVKSVELNLGKFDNKFEKSAVVGLQSVLMELEEIFSGRLLQV